MSVTIDGVRVRVERGAEYGRYEIVVQVNSRKRAALWATNRIDPGQFSGVAAVAERVGIAAAAGAEYLGQYGDNIDTEAARRAGIRAFQEECRLLAELSRDLPAKLKRLKAHAGALSAQAAERVARYTWAVEHNEPLTAGQVNWINDQLAKIHDTQL